ncbi:High-affinity nicotinic acid transporter [Zancudomyces culisetae]|uniref:High-affinity nicotinic acid transporter n=1 Tax=Zancudomyces culisetae TaxID=1213189 RepID=A0A1R1PDC5_ZANCU|nr:High-affinity nicotinic acid transporter [Zancudomyces culisetae]|eukprot:OMH78966.1 High-affinity nicotinic acid transporter [Zancudomyces culisetae]
MSDKEKQELTTINQDEVLTPREQMVVKQYLKKVDIRILPIFSLVYLLAVMDRANIGSAINLGLGDTVKFTKQQAPWNVSIFFVFYIICETPANILLKKLKPHIWFTIIVCGWSITCILMTWARTPATLLTARGFLGAFESGLTPGVVGYMPYWYTRSEIGLRMSIFFAAGTLSGVFGGPIAVGLSSLTIGNIPSYAIIFLIEGIVSLLVGISLYFLVYDYPDTVKFFTPEEKELIVRRITNDQGLASKTSMSMKQTINALLDWKMWLYAVMFFAVNFAGVTLGVFGPVLVSSLGFSSIRGTLMSSLPNAAGFIGQLLTGYTMARFPLWLNSIVFAAIGCFGICMVAFTHFSPVPKLIMLCIGGFGVFPNIPIIATWMSINMGGISKRMVASAMTVSFGGIAGITAPLAFNKELYAPKFTLGLALNTACLALICVLALFFKFYYDMENRRRDNNPVDVSHLSEFEQRELNDKHPDFRYKL